MVVLQSPQQYSSHNCMTVELGSVEGQNPLAGYKTIYNLMIQSLEHKSLDNMDLYIYFLRYTYEDSGADIFFPVIHTNF